MNINIRRMFVSDLEKIMVIEPKAFGTNHWSKESFINELNNPFAHYYCAVSKLDCNDIMGYSGYWLFQQEAHITTLATRPDVKRNKIGEKLLLNNILTAKEFDANWLTLEVRLSNTPAQNLYYKFGFKNIGIRKRYYKDNNEDAIILWTDNINNQDYMKLISEKSQNYGLQLDIEIL